MALQTEVWVKDIEEKLFEGSEFINTSTNHDSFIVNKTVHIPQAGTISAVTKNRGTFPAVAETRTDADHTYQVDSYSTTPLTVTDFEELQISYAKRQSFLGQSIDKLNEEMGTQTAHKWAPEGNTIKVIPTTGALTSLGADGVTAMRKITVADITAAAKKLDLDKVPANNRYLLMDTEMYYELFSIEELINRNYMDKTALPKGVIDFLFGFNIMVRPTTVTYDITTASAPAKEAVGAAPGVKSARGCIAWQQSYVAKAKGSVNVFLRENDPLYYGDVLSTEIVLGASAMRNDSRATGVVAISQIDA